MLSACQGDANRGIGDVLLPHSTKLPPNAPDRTSGRVRIASGQPLSIPRDAAVFRAAFCELHGPRLHGFALLVTLGDSHRAIKIAGEALAAGARVTPSLRHPERAAAWLRARVLRDARRLPISIQRPDPQARRDALAAIGVGKRAFAGLAALSPRGRAVIVALDVEHLNERDAEQILGFSTAALRRFAARTRREFATACEGIGLVSALSGGGGIMQRVREAAHRALP